MRAFKVKRSILVLESTHKICDDRLHFFIILLAKSKLGIALGKRAAIGSSFFLLARHKESYFASGFPARHEAEAS